MYFVLYKDQSLLSQWRWTLYAANHKKIANSGEGYFNKADAKSAIALVTSASYLTPIRER